MTTGSVASEVIVGAGPENRPTVATELLRAEAGDVQATTVTMDRAGAEQVTAERVVMTNSGARTVEARSAQVDRSGILAVRSEKAVFSNSTAIAIATEEARIVRSRVLMLKADGQDRSRDQGRDLRRTGRLKGATAGRCPGSRRIWSWVGSGAAVTWLSSAPDRAVS